MQVSVIYASVSELVEIPVEVPANANVDMAIKRSQIMTHFQEIDLQKLRIGIFSRFVTLDAPLHEGDRIEIYRPLTIDPKEARLLRAARKKP
jgi:uncharacterized protein